MNNLQLQANFKQARIKNNNLIKLFKNRTKMKKMKLIKKKLSVFLKKIYMMKKMRTLYRIRADITNLVAQCFLIKMLKMIYKNSMKFKIMNYYMIR